MSKYRKATSLRKGWQIAHQTDGPVEWVTVKQTSIMGFASGHRVVNVYYDDGTWTDYPADVEVLCRTRSEVPKSERAETKAS